MQFRMENDDLLVEVADMGAEMQRIWDKRRGREVLWNGRPDVWKRRAPWLFPVIGQLRDGRVRVQGREYALPKHGFALTSAFDMRQVSPTEVLAVLRASTETLARYPWRFRLEIRYALEGGSLCVRARVACEEDREMIFSFGAHPGFLCGAGDEIEFARDGALDCRRLDIATHLLAPESTPMPAKFALADELFAADAMLFRRPRSTGATLRRRDGSGVRFEFGEVPWVGVWTKAGKGLPYVCIEPWHGVDDPLDAAGDFESKLDAVHLPAGETFAMDLKITPF